MRYHLDPDTRTTPDDQLLADLRRVAHRHRATHVTYVRRFGSWNNALKRAGLRIAKRRGVPDAEAFAQLEHMWRTLGRQPRLADFDQIPTTLGPSLYLKRFGGWRAALRAFIEWVNNQNRRARTPTPGSERTGDDPDPPAPGTQESGSSEYLRTRRGAQEKPVHRTTRTARPRLRYRVLQRDRFCCVACGRSPATDAGVVLHVDHKHPWSAGGETTLDNLQTLCERCNIGKGASALSKQSR